MYIEGVRGSLRGSATGVQPCFMICACLWKRYEKQSSAWSVRRSAGRRGALSSLRASSVT
jgi:hypothetical protein